MQSRTPPKKTTYFPFEVLTLLTMQTFIFTVKLLVLLLHSFQSFHGLVLLRTQVFQNMGWAVGWVWAVGEGGEVELERFMSTIDCRVGLILPWQVI